jgi:hypothetical protein
MYTLRQSTAPLPTLERQGKQPSGLGEVLHTPRRVVGDGYWFISQLGFPHFGAWHLYNQCTWWSVRQNQGDEGKRYHTSKKLAH